ncbi:division/cell wall cluster transcriptional repressor MraZ [Rhodobacter sp. NTK016B]|uniref:division/cell wall cluster transcriptional repressor MraZ n=1 Tax=Rhodobacter sp. NTK016B TaxID=2759676 RepID=UPI001A8DC523|nr:division/cell wall cluster transcriptional repressor MraZ [Rhodobacter sp. NTK016B]MBN8290519.1 division/cell wall cluster transcriptional repressor MraZ [Rhodobacter sp. NTK016B]
MRRKTVARGFRGSETQTIDAKGRVSIPPRFRRVIEAGDPDWETGKRANMVIVFGPPTQNYLKCYTIKEIERIEERIKLLPNGSKRRRALEKIYHALADDIEVMEDGRILLPVKLRTKLDLTKQALFVAASDQFMIYKPETYEEEEGGFEDIFADEDDDFDYESWLPELPAKTETPE